MGNRGGLNILIISNLLCNSNLPEYHLSEGLVGQQQTCYLKRVSVHDHALYCMSEHACMSECVSEHACVCVSVCVCVCVSECVCVHV